MAKFTGEHSKLRKQPAAATQQSTRRTPPQTARVSRSAAFIALIMFILYMALGVAILESGVPFVPFGPRGPAPCRPPQVGAWPDYHDRSPDVPVRAH